MTGDDFIALAGKLAVMFHDASTCRTIVGRAYYGGFHLARTFLEQLGVHPPRNANIHVFVQRCLLNSDHPEATSAGSLLNNLHSDRIKADYDLGALAVESASVARICVERARSIQSSLGRCSGDDQRQLIRQAIDDFLSKQKPKPAS